MRKFLVAFCFIVGSKTLPAQTMVRATASVTIVLEAEFEPENEVGLRTGVEADTRLGLLPFGLWPGEGSAGTVAVISKKRVFSTSLVPLPAEKENTAVNAPAEIFLAVHYH